MKSYKDNFPIFKNYPDMIYLDSAATCQKPEMVINAFGYFYSHLNANIGRGSYHLADLAQDTYNESKKTVANFFSVKPNQVVFTYGATDGLNQAAYMLQDIYNKKLLKKKYIIVSALEHHSNILPWIRMANNLGLTIYTCTIEETFDPETISKEILNHTFVMSTTHVSNVTGEIVPVNEWTRVAQEHGSFSVIDGSQAVSFFRIRIDKIESDFYLFSAHKMYGPMGVGALLLSEKVLNIKPDPFRLGGGIVEDVPTHIVSNQIQLTNEYILTEDTERYETGTPNLANIYAMAQAINWMLSYQWYNAITYMDVLSEYLYSNLNAIGIEPLKSHKKSKQTHVASFVVKGIHSHDIGTFLHKKNIAARSGKHCAYPLYDTLNINSSTRYSIGIYNTHADIDKAVAAIEEARAFFTKD